MIEIYTTATFDELFLKLPKKIRIKADDKTKLFRQNPFSPVLRTEKLHPKGHDVWSFRVDIH
jgi:Txe/YoeB family toxin of Txe-Axe toxin-antitoxin module